MPRTGRRRSLTIAAALTAVLAAPAAAHAAAYTVKSGDGPCGAPSDLACGDLTQAADAAAPGDVFTVSSGIYGSATFTVGGITITGSPTFAVNGSLAFTASTGGITKVQHMGLSQQNGSAAGVISSGSAGLQIEDSTVAALNGDGVTFSQGTANKIVRSLVATGGQDTAAVRVTSADASTAAKRLTMDSSLLVGGVASLSVNTGNGNGLTSHPGDVDVVLHHVTAAGSTHGLVLDASKANPLIGGPFGNITAEVSDSIIQNGTAKTVYAGVLGTLTITAPPNTVTDTYTRTLQNFDPNAVFADPSNHNYRLKAGSPAINAGGVTAGESPTDIDGNDRSTAPTDQGADEYVAPTASTTTTPPPAPGTGDGVPPEVVIVKPSESQKVKLTTKTTKTKTVTKKGKKVKVKKTTTKRNKITISGTSKDASGIKAIVLTLRKLGTPSGAKCLYLNATKGLVSKTCTKPVLLTAKLGKDGAWSFSVKSTIHLSAGKYQAVALGLDNSGAAGNTAGAKGGIRTFTLVK